MEILNIASKCRTISVAIISVLGEMQNFIARNYRCSHCNCGIRADPVLNNLQRDPLVFTRS